MVSWSASNPFKFSDKRPMVTVKFKFKGFCSIMTVFFKKGRIAKAAMAIFLMVAIFMAGAQRGYDLGFIDGEKKANSWWIDKKSNYYESTKIKQKRIKMKTNEV